ncbi:MAG: NAD(P)H-dependent oxidoreductase, partial [Myxococcota bacterium]
SQASANGVLIDVITLATESRSIDDVVAELRAANGFVVVTGTYWGSWGSPLQRFFEVMTPWEATDVFLGKPVGAVVTMESVSGAEVGARLLSTMNLLGCAIVPLGLVVLSRIGRLVEDDPAYSDVWQVTDIDILIENLALSTSARSRIERWPTEVIPQIEGAYPAPGALNTGLRNGVFVRQT